MRIPLLLAITLLSLAGVSWSAAGAGPTYHATGTLNGLPAGNPAYKDSNDYSVWLYAGDEISATLEWFDLSADLDLILIPPGGSCTISATTTSVNCIVDSVPGRVDPCRGQPNGGPLLAQGPEWWTRTATVTGVYKVSVQGTFLLPDQPVDYAITISIAGNAHTASIEGPASISYVGASTCKVTAPSEAGA